MKAPALNAGKGVLAFFCRVLLISATFTAMTAGGPREFPLNEGKYGYGVFDLADN